MNSYFEYQIKERGGEGTGIGRTRNEHKYQAYHNKEKGQILARSYPRKKLHENPPCVRAITLVVCARPLRGTPETKTLPPSTVIPSPARPVLAMVYREKDEKNR